METDEGPNIIEGELDRCGDEIRQALQTDDVDAKVAHLDKVREIFATSTQLDDLLDSYLDELIDFIAIPETQMRVFIVRFIEQICLRECSVIRKAIAQYVGLLNEESSNVAVIKAVMQSCTILYPVMLKWAVDKRDEGEAQKGWEAFLVIKGKIMDHIESDNHGVRMMTIKFLECVVLSQSMRTELSVGGADGSMCLNSIPPDHKFISYRRMQMEAVHSLQNLLEQMCLPHISGQNLIVVIGCVMNIARQRPDFMSKVIDSIEILHVNLPPTLLTSQVKSVRKELKMQLLRLLKHEAAVSLHARLRTLLVDLGASLSEIQRAIPEAIKESMKSRKRQAMEESAAAEAKRNRIEEGPENRPGTSRAELSQMLNDEDYADEVDTKDVGEKSIHHTVPISKARSCFSAIDITSQFIFDRLKPSVVANLVIISLVTLPDEMPPAFQSSYTPIAQAGTEEQRRHLSRMMAAQATASGLGPGYEELGKEKFKQFTERQNLRSEGAVIPPTPAYALGGGPSASFKTPVLPGRPKKAELLDAALPQVAPSIQEFDIIGDCRPFSRDEMLKIFEMAFQSVMDAEVVARKSNMYSIHNKVLVRLATRFHTVELDFTQSMVDFIVAEHKSRADLAVLWVAELYAQYQGYSLCYAHGRPNGEWTKEEKLSKYDKTLTLLVKTMFEQELHKEMAFHRLFLEAPLITASSLMWLKAACLDEVYGTFCMTTLREMIMTRSRQRDALLDLLVQLAHHEGTESCEQSIAIAKELYELPYVRPDVIRHLSGQLQSTLTDPPPQYFAKADQPPPKQWTDELYRCALHIFLDLMPVDPALLLKLSKVYSKSSSTFKKICLRMIESPLKLMSMRCKEVVQLVDECPVGAETLVARVVQLLSEKSAVTQEIVKGMKKLHEERKTDVRSLIPALTGLPKKEIEALLPAFVLNAAYQKSVSHVFKRLLQGRNIETGEPPLSPVDCIVSYHHLTPRNEEQRNLHISNLEVLYSNRMMTKDVVGAAVERLLDDRPLCDLFFHTLVSVSQRWPALDGFLANVLSKVVNKELWKNTPEQKQSFFSAFDKLQSVSYSVILTGFNSEEFKEYLATVNDEEALLQKLRDFLPQLSTHQQRNMSQTILDMVKGDRNDRERERDSRRDKDREEREHRERRSRRI